MMNLLIEKKWRRLCYREEIDDVRFPEEGLGFDELNMLRLGFEYCLVVIIG
ncbi:hypothetical protein HanIR_Chr16g0792801 [Helianthus annuus]|nr:hypothetical protein HanIR_Chr16g0792801 [Helianthus annuus]